MFMIHVGHVGQISSTIAWCQCKNSTGKEPLEFTA